VNEEAAFLHKLRENPDDDTTRLVYADWLDERDDPRAELIRLRQQHAQLIGRINELAGQCDSEWLAAVGGPQLKPEYITLRSGRSLRLGALKQGGIYSGHEGLPTTELNERRIESILSSEREHSGTEPYLIRANERPIKLHEDRSYAFGAPAVLPWIVCAGRFRSSSPAQDPNRKSSKLTVIWFQDEFAFPIDPAIREQIRAIDWEKHATDSDH
jgi:uncharacterized protein (TIGR02996 family)